VVRIVVTDFIGDFSRLATNENVGVVLPSLDSKGYDYAVENLTRLGGEDKKSLAERCRKTAESNFSIKTVGAARYREIYQRLLNE
jgi:hypothetical protein